MEEQAKLSVLVVEDDIDLSISLVETLNDMGLIAIGVRTVREATFKLKNQAFHCVILDIKLGAESGETVIDSMRENPKSPNHLTPVVLMSGYLDMDLLKKIGPKVQGAIVKPFTPKDLLHKMKSILLKAAS